MKMSILVLGLAVVSTILVWLWLLTDGPETHAKCRQECGGGTVSSAQKDDGSISSLLDYDPTDPAERVKADEKIIAFLREYTGHSLGDDFAVAGFSTNKSTVTFPARKPFGIFDLVEVSQLTKEGGAARPTGKIQSFCFRPSRKYGATNFTHKTAREMMIQTGRDLAKRVDLQEDYYLVSPFGRDRLKKRLDRQKSARKPYPNIKMHLSCANLHRRAGGVDPTVGEWSFSLTFDLSTRQDKSPEEYDKSDDEIIIEWRFEQQQFIEIDKCYSHGIFVDEPKSDQWTWVISTMSRWESVSSEVADIHFMTAFRHLTGFELGQGYVSGIVVSTNDAMDCETQEVDMPVKFCTAKREQLLFKNGRLYGVSIQVPFCDASRKMAKRTNRILAAERDGVWNEMRALFDIEEGLGCVDSFILKREIARCYGWNFAAAPMPVKTPTRIELSVAFEAYHKELRDGTQGVIVDIERLRNLNDDEKRSYKQIRETANELDAKEHLEAQSSIQHEFSRRLREDREKQGAKLRQIKDWYENAIKGLKDKLKALSCELEEYKKEVEQIVDDHEKARRIEKMKRIKEEMEEVLSRGKKEIDKEFLRRLQGWREEGKGWREEVLKDKSLERLRVK